MVEISLGIGVVLLSLALALGLLVYQQHCTPQTRGMVGLLATVIHMVATLVLAAIAWAWFRPAHVLVMALSLLVGYWVSLIFLVIAIIRWLRRDSGTPSPEAGNL